MNITEHYRELGLQVGTSYEELVRAYRKRMLSHDVDSAAEIGELRRHAAIDAFVAIRKHLKDGRSRVTRPGLSGDPSQWRESEVFKFQRTPIEKSSWHFPAAKAPIPPHRPALVPKPLITEEASKPVSSTIGISLLVVFGLFYILSLGGDPKLAVAVESIHPMRLEKAVAPAAASGKVTPTPPPLIDTTGRIVVRCNRPDVLVGLAPVGSRIGSANEAPVMGTHEFSNLGAGEYRVVARLEGWPPIERTISLAAEKTVETFFEFKTGTLKIESDPSGATVLLENKILGKTPLSIADLAPKTYTFHLRYDWWPETKILQAIEPGSEKTLAVRFPRGKVAVNSSPPGAILSVDGTEFGRTPVTFDALPAGQRKLQLRAENYHPFETVLNVMDGSNLQISPTLSSSLPRLIPSDVLSQAWNDNASRISRGGAQATSPKNGVIKNLDRQTLDMLALKRKFTFSAAVRNYDSKSGKIEFVDEEGLRSKYRVIAQLSNDARLNSSFTNKLLKGAIVEISGILSAVEEPRWPSKVIVFEIDAAAPTN